MTVTLPPDMPVDVAERIKEEERRYARALQREGKWLHLWRIAGRYANLSIFDVASHEELHELLANLPLFPYMDMNIVPLVRHPSAL